VRCLDDVVNGRDAAALDLDKLQHRHGVTFL